VRRRDVLLALLGGGSVALLGLPARAPASGRGTTAIRIGLVFDVGGRGDKSFNDSAYAGLLESTRAHGAGFELAEPTGAEDREAAMRLFAARGFDLVIGVGHIFTHDMIEVARTFPSVRFACVDFSAPPPLPENLAGLVFREEEGSFLVGAAAALESRTGHIGFVGGMNIDLIRKFEAGYRAGARAVRPSCVVHAAYAGTTPDAFRDPAKGKAIAASQIASGVDVLFHASGSTGGGVFEAARAARARAIGVDRDQAEEMPGVVITSMIKRVDTAVSDVVRSVVERAFSGGLRAFGVKERGVDWIHEGPHATLLAAETIRRVEALREDVIEGRVSVPTAP
jgi:basic membrane protein A and related proteins